MDKYIDVALLGRVLVYALVAGVAVTSTFALGARSLARADGARTAARPAGAYTALAGLCFLAAGAAVVIGLWFVLDK